jgi:hypothetical protein
MSALRCQSCSATGYLLPVVALNALLCLECDRDFAAWHRPGTVATEWPGWYRRPGTAVTGAQRARDRVRDAGVAAIPGRPLTACTRARVDLWHSVRAGGAA